MKKADTNLIEKTWNKKSAMVWSLKSLRLHLRKKKEKNSKYIKEKPKTTFVFRIHFSRGWTTSTQDTLDTDDQSFSAGTLKYACLQDGGHATEKVGIFNSVSKRMACNDNNRAMHSVKCRWTNQNETIGCFPFRPQRQKDTELSECILEVDMTS